MSWQATYNQWRQIGHGYLPIRDEVYAHPELYPLYQWADGRDLKKIGLRWGWTLLPVMVYCMKPDAQIAFKDYYDPASPIWIYHEGTASTPTWDGGVVQETTLDTACGNTTVFLLGSTEVTRSQTSRLVTYISNWRVLTPQICAYVTVPHELPDGITATIQRITELPITIQASILGNAEKAVGIRAAIRDQPELAPGIVAAAAKTDELPAGIITTIQNDTQLNPWIRTAIKGETELEVSIATFIVVSRKDTIRLEMENLGPQEFAHRAVPNWASRVKDYRTDSLGS